MTATDTRAAMERQAWIVRQVEDHAPQFHRVCPGSEARYVIEGWVKDATPGEWDFADDYVRAHPELFTGPVVGNAEIIERNAAAGRELDHEAAAAFRAGDWPLALYLIDAADWWHPVGEPKLTRIREALVAKISEAGNE